MSGFGWFGDVIDGSSSGMWSMWGVVMMIGRFVWSVLDFFEVLVKFVGYCGGWGRFVWKGCDERVDEGWKCLFWSWEGLGLENDISVFDCFVDGWEIKEEKEWCIWFWVKMYEGLWRVKDWVGIFEVGVIVWGKWKYIRLVFD